ncbi:MAG: M24 family metallopeptidase [Bacteroidetes bacterium]|jgi:Xaa-Pro aminopeptidase|nr:M24 family metallopeptidase [Bacteroidota bacterium]
MPLRSLHFLLDEYDVDAALLTFLPDIRWATGFTGSNGVLLVKRDQVYFVTDGRYEDQAKQEVRGAAVHVPGYALHEHIAEEGWLHAGDRVLFQADYVTVNERSRWDDVYDTIDWHGETRVLAQAVAKKTESEIDAIRRAQAVTEAVWSDVLDLLRPGLTEREVAAAITYRHLQRGAERMAFEPIVASGANAARPHARATDRRLESGDVVLVDMGGVVDGYASDMTRTVVLGSPPPDFAEVYGVVREAQEAAIDAARAGMASDALDDVARSLIDAAGYGEAFSHSLGHGIGLQVHEWPPVSFRSEDALPEGAAITIEPGIYLPGAFGVRIEDIIVLRKDGCDRLTQASKELLVL